MNLKNYIKPLSKLGAAIVLFSLGACSDNAIPDSYIEDNDSNSAGKVKGEGPFYMSFYLKPVDGTPTRAEGDEGNEGDDFSFTDGQGDESRIKNIMFLFFSEDGVLKWSEKPNISDLKEDTDEEDVEWEFNTLITIPLGENEEDVKKLKSRLDSITSFIAIVNYPEKFESKLTFDNGTFMKRDDIYKQLTLDTINATIDKNECFIMTNAGHYKNNNNTLGDYIYYEEKGEDPLFYESETLARENARTIYVERLAVRVDFKIDPKKIQPVKVFYGTDVYNLDFVPDAWGFEAEEKTEYLLKQQNDNSLTDNFPSGFKNWSNYQYHRTYWAESPTFENGKYAAKGDGSESNLSLHYTSFQNLLEKDNRKGQLKEKTIDNTLFKIGSLYTKEHTFKNSELKESYTGDSMYNPYAVPTSIVLRGRYKVTFDHTDERDPRPGVSEGQDEDIKNGNLTHTPTHQIGDSLRLYNAGFYIRFVDMERVNESEKDPVAPGESYEYRLYREKNDEGKDDLFLAFQKEQYMIWKKVGDGYELLKDDDHTLFEIVNTKQIWDPALDKFIPASNTYTLQLLSPGTNLYLKTSKESEYTLITSANLATANDALQKQLGYAQRYYQSYAFFYAPIPHYLSDPTYTGLYKYTETKQRDYKKFTPNHLTAEFSVVRNHIYNFTIEGISKLGYGIPTLETIPLPEPRLGHDLYNFDMKLYILPWNQFNYVFDI